MAQLKVLGPVRWLQCQVFIQSSSHAVLSELWSSGWVVSQAKTGHKSFSWESTSARRGMPSYLPCRRWIDSWRKAGTDGWRTLIMCQPQCILTYLDILAFVHIWYFWTSSLHAWPQLASSCLSTFRNVWHRTTVCDQAIAKASWCCHDAKEITDDITAVMVYLWPAWAHMGPLCLHPKEIILHC